MEHIYVYNCVFADTDVAVELDMDSGVDILILIYGQEQKWIKIR